LRSRLLPLVTDRSRRFAGGRSASPWYFSPWRWRGRRRFAPLNRLWLKIRPAASPVISPIILALLFYVTVHAHRAAHAHPRQGPVAIALDPRGEYWIPRESAGAGANIHEKPVLRSDMMSS